MQPDTIEANVDPSELAKFSESAHRWWDTSSEYAPLHAMNPLRLDWIAAHLPLAGQKIVDVGCGGGILSEAMARRGANVLGIDLATKSLKVARLHALEAQVENIQYREIAVEALAAEQPRSFDAVTCMELLEHVPDPASVVDACARLVKPGGWVFFSTIHRNLKSFALAILAAEHILQLLPKGTHRYDRLIRPSELAGWCRAAGLDVRELTGIHYNPFTRRFWLAANVGVNYLLACRAR